MKARKSNFELMRIISMYMIVIWHIFLYGVNMETALPKMKMFFDIFRSIMVVHVNSFVLLSGFFQSQSKFKLSKVIQLNNAVVFYKIVIFLIFCFLGIAQVNSITIIRNFFPADLENYWFIRIYLIMYIFSPFYNYFLDTLTRKQHFNLLFIMFLLFSVLSTWTNQEALVSQTVHYGYSIVSFTFLYFIGAYIRKYPIEKTYFGKKFSYSAQHLIFIFLFFLFACFNFSLHMASIEFLKYEGFFNYIGKKLFISFNQYDNPLVLFGSISYFMCFYYMSFSNKIINKIASTTIGIYLIHENLFIRNNVYGLFKFPKVVKYRKTFVHIAVVGIIIFLICFVIDFLRQLVFKFVYKRKVSSWWRNKYRNYISSLGFHINW